MPFSFSPLFKWPYGKNRRHYCDNILFVYFFFIFLLEVINANGKKKIILHHVICKCCVTFGCTSNTYTLICPSRVVGCENNETTRVKMNFFSLLAFSISLFFQETSTVNSCIVSPLNSSENLQYMKTGKRERRTTIGNVIKPNINSCKDMIRTYIQHSSVHWYLKFVFSKLIHNLAGNTNTTDRKFALVYFFLWTITSPSVCEYVKKSEIKTQCFHALQYLFSLYTRYEFVLCYTFYCYTVADFPANCRSV